VVADDVVRIRSHTLSHNLKSEVSRALVLREFGPDVERVRRRLEPERETVVPEGLDLDLIPADVLEVYDLARSGVEFGASILNGHHAAVSAVLRSSGVHAARPPASQHESNGWAVAPQRTETGRPILANDPHRDQAVPSLRYTVHLVAPGLDVIGAGEPGVPGLSYGHNGSVAFGGTLFFADQEDLYVYETKPDDPHRYKYCGYWEPMQVERQLVQASGEEPVSVELKFTRHGPVIYEDPAKNVAFAVRAAWLEPGGAPYMNSLKYLECENREGFLEATASWGAPPVNHVYADVAGNIGWRPAGFVPIRPNWDGLLPVPGDGRYEWNGFLRMQDLPMEFNPSKGWVATANQMNIPEDYPHEERKVGFEWWPPFRYQRIAEVLNENANCTVQDSLRLQTDYLSIPARRIVSQLIDLSTENSGTSRALAMLKGWDHVLSAESSAAALFEVWYRAHLRPTLVAKAVPPKAVAAVSTDDQVGDAQVLMDLIESPDARLGREPAKARDEAVLRSLGEAFLHLKEILGPIPEAWRWGDLHQAFLAHPVLKLLDEEAKLRKWDVGPLPRGGSNDTVGATDYGSDGFRQTGGSSWRMVLDVGGWDNSLAMNSPGQSGDPRSAHYADLFRPWAEDEAFPLLFSRDKVKAAAESTILLRPAE